MTVAQTLEPLVLEALGGPPPVRVRCWDGSELGPPEAPATVHFVRRRALRRLLWAPNELGFARAYVSGDIELEGDLLTGLSALDELAEPGQGPGVQITPAMARTVARAALRLRAVGPPVRPPAEEAPLTGHRHTRGSDAEAIAHHYDVSNGFYRLVLGESMVYSCAYWARGPGQHDGTGSPLAGAQLAKCDLVARKLGLEPGVRVLDVGCGWGTFVLHAARTYGVRAVGVTLSREQADHARARVEQEGLTDLVEIRLQDYRDVDDGPYDAIASIGMAEHVGRSMLPAYAADLFAQLRPGGRLLNHAIARRSGPPSTFSKTSFIDRYVFPDGELETLGTMVGVLEEAGFEVRDTESLREHYALTLRAWVANLERRWDEAVRLTSAGRARVWRLYIAGSALAFEDNRLGVNQVLAVRPDPRGRSGMPLVRDPRHTHRSIEEPPESAQQQQTRQEGHPT